MVMGCCHISSLIWTQEPYLQEVSRNSLGSAIIISNILLAHSFQILTSDMNQPEWRLGQAIFLEHLKAFTGSSDEEFQCGAAVL